MYGAYLVSDVYEKTAELIQKLRHKFPIAEWEIEVIEAWGDANEGYFYDSEIIHQYRLADGENTWRQLAALLRAQNSRVCSNRSVW